MAAHGAISALFFFSCGLLCGASLSVVVKDPSEAVIAGATVTAAGKGLPTPLEAFTDSAGRVRFDQLPNGSFRISVAKDGFETWDRIVSVAAKPVGLAVSLKIKVTTETVQVSGKRSPLANSDPNYIALRTGKLSKVYRVKNLVLHRDVGTFTFRTGSFSFLPPVLNHVVTGVFVGDGNFQLKPTGDMALKHLRSSAALSSVDEDFTAMVVYFSDSTFDEIKQHSELADEAPQRHEEAFQHLKYVLQWRREPGTLRAEFGGMTLLERLLNFEDIPNEEAEVLAELYNSAQGASFRAFLQGKKYPDLRFLLNPRGAIPMLHAPEEVALLNYDPLGDRDGIWYLAHLTSEVQSGAANSKEEKRLIAAEHYEIQAIVRVPNLAGKMPDLAASCDLRFRSLEDGTRMMKFDLFPDIQVSRVAWNGKEIAFVQESRKRDGSFYLQMPEALVKGRAYQISFDFSGGTVGMGSSRMAWYPSPSGPASRATYHLEFHIPRGSTIVSVGNLGTQTREGAFDVSQWVSDAALEHAVFCYLPVVYTKNITEETTHMELRAYVTPGRGTGARAEPPPPGPGTINSLQAIAPLPAVGPQPSLSPQPAAVMAGRGVIRAGIQPSSPSAVLVDAGNAVRVFYWWFGPSSYKSLSVVEAGGVASLPGLVYAPPILFAGYNATMPGEMKVPLDEAFARAVSVQWWGNTVGTASFHDEWLSGGFANFSTSLFDLASGSKDFQDHWEIARNALLHAPKSFQSEIRPTDTGSLWMGILNDTYYAGGAGAIVNVMKGGFILQMLRCMMWDPKSNDNDFRALMQDYVKRFANQAASTEDFKAVVEQHMKPVMDLDNNHRMDWFFNDWVYGTDIPSYRLEYSLAPAENGKTLLSGKLTQSGVSSQFAMPVPIFGQFGFKNVRIGVIPIRGNSTGEFQVQLPEMPQQVALNVDHDVLTDREEVKKIAGAK